jgi:predicted DNA-binding helix-hairpin-helix protein
MEQVVEVARVLREEHDFRGYIHLKTIPDASARTAARAGRYADRLSINIELPTEQGLEALAPEKDDAAIKRSMARLRVHIDDAEGRSARRGPQPVTLSLPARGARRAKPPRSPRPARARR